MTCIGVPNLLFGIVSVCLPLVLPSDDLETFQGCFPAFSCTMGDPNEFWSRINNMDLGRTGNYAGYMCPFGQLIVVG